MKGKMHLLEQLRSDSMCIGWTVSPMARSHFRASETEWGGEEIYA